MQPRIDLSQAPCGPSSEGGIGHIRFASAAMSRPAPDAPRRKCLHGVPARFIDRPAELPFAHGEPAIQVEIVSSRALPTEIGSHGVVLQSAPGVLIVLV